MSDDSQLQLALKDRDTSLILTKARSGLIARGLRDAARLTASSEEPTDPLANELTPEQLAKAQADREAALLERMLNMAHDAGTQAAEAMATASPPEPTDPFTLILSEASRVCEKWGLDNAGRPRQPFDGQDLRGLQARAVGEIVKRLDELGLAQESFWLREECVSVVHQGIGWSPDDFDVALKGLGNKLKHVEAMNAKAREDIKEIPDWDEVAKAAAEDEDAPEWTVEDHPTLMGLFANSDVRAFVLYHFAKNPEALQNLLEMTKTPEAQIKAFQDLEGRIRALSRPDDSITKKLDEILRPLHP